MKLGIVLSLFAVTRVFAVELFHHEIPAYPKGVNCEITSQVLAKQFSERTGLEIYWSGVTKENLTSCDLKISYLAEGALTFTKSVDRGDVGSLERGVYATLGECEEKLPREKQLMEIATGLSVWLSYCYKEDRFLDGLPFVPVVEAIGRGKLGFFASDEIIGVTPLNGWQEVVDEINRNSQRLEIIPATIVFRPFIVASDKKATIRFYAKERLSLSHEKYGKHSDAKICEAQLAQVKAGLLTAKIPPLATYCGKYSNKVNYLSLMGLSKNIFGVGNIQAKVDPKQYASLEACLEKVPDTLGFYKDKLGKQTLTAFCSNENGPFQTTVFYEQAL